jgi:hypothetical protein
MTSLRRLWYWVTGTPTPPKPDPHDDAEAPLVILGQGDFAKAIYPRDL